VALTNGDIVAIFALIFAILSYLFTWLLTRSKGPKMEIIGVKYILGDISTEGATYTITIERYVRNKGDTRDYIIYKPKIIVYNKDGNLVEELQNTESRYPIAPGEPDYRHESFVLKRKTYDIWETGEVIFNAGYYNKKGTLIPLKKDSFHITKK